MLKPHRPLRVAVLCSHRAPGLLYLLNQSPDRAVAYEIVCCVTSERAYAEAERVDRRGIPTHAHPIAAFYEAFGARDRGDRDARAAYDAETLNIIAPYLADLVLLDGYLYLVTAPLLTRFANRVINLHFSDLTLRTAGRGPRFPGIHAVRDALTAGQRETRATVHLVNEAADAGPPIVRSWPFPVSPLVDDLRTQDAAEVLRAYAFAHEQWMMRTVSGPLIAAALRLLATGAVDLDALASTPRGDHASWLLERHGFLLAPEVDVPAVVG